MNTKLNSKLKSLEKELAKLSSFAVAFSGGVDSTLLLAVARTVNTKQVLAITLSSQFVPQSEIEFTKKIARSLGVEHICLDVDIFENDYVISNTLERCYFCKKQMFALIRDTAKKSGITNLLHGINLDDLKDFRPGLKASEELGFLSPFVEAGFSKKDIRTVSKQMELETWNKPSQSCFATRIAYDEKITVEKLYMVENAESFLKELGLDHVRVRYCENSARIEVDPDHIDKLSGQEKRKKISKYFSQLGFDHTSIDIDGYKIT